MDINKSPNSMKFKSLVVSSSEIIGKDECVPIRRSVDFNYYGFIWDTRLLVQWLIGAMCETLCLLVSGHVGGGQ